MILMAASMSLAFKSGILVWAISRSCSRVILPTLERLGSLEPTSMPAAFLSNTEAGES